MFRKLTGGSIALLCYLVLPSQDAAAQTNRSAPARVVVKFRSETSVAARAALLQANGHQLDRTIPQLDAHIVRVPRGKTAAEVMAKYEKHPLVEYVEMETFAEPAGTADTSPNDPWFVYNQGALRILGAEETWLNLTTGSANIPIGILDTGLSRGHFEFTNRVIWGYDFLDGDADFEDTNGNGHGTLVAGVIGAGTNNTLGIAGATWDNPLVIMRTGFGFDAREAILWAADNGVRVINMSFITVNTSSWEATCQYAFDRGVVLVAAAGNGGISDPTYPAAYPTVLGVTGIYADGRPAGYNWGEWVDISAPASGVSTTYPLALDADGIGYSGGTSIAAPFLAAAAGLVLSVNPNLSAQCVMDILTDTADDVWDPGFDVYTGHGRVNFYQAVLAAQTWNCSSTADVTPPTAAVVSPTSGQVLSGTVSILAGATDDVRVTRVDLFVDGSFVSSDTVAPHEWFFDTTTLAGGGHTVSAAAFDAAGNSATSTGVVVTVDNTSPTVSLTAPSNGTTVTGMITISASATDNLALDRVEFYRDGNVLLGADSSAPYGMAWDSASASDGSHTLYAKACDRAGNETASAPRTVTVAGTVDNTPPAVAISSPFDGSAVFAKSKVTITAAASDAAGVGKVEFYVDGVLKGTDATSTYNYVWKVPARKGRTYRLLAKAYDANGNVGSSGTVTVTSK